LSHTGTSLTPSIHEVSVSLIPTVFPPFACAVAAELSATPLSGGERWPPASRVLLARQGRGHRILPHSQDALEKRPS
jgi:hypothetical protein